MLNPKLKHHQAAAAEAALEAIGGGRDRGLIVCPTGTGKTWLFCELARVLAVPTLVIVHRDELVQQTLDTLGRAWPDCKHGVVKDTRNEWDAEDVVVASVQSLNAKRLEKIPKDRFGLVVADEAHHGVAPSWARAIEHFERGFLLGVTATPDRLDGKGLGEMFGGAVLFNYTLLAAIQDGNLCRLAQFAVKTEAVLDGISTVAGDFARDELSRAVNTAGRNRALVEAFQQHAAGRRAVAFCVQHAADLALAFTEADVPSAFVSGEMGLEERRDVLARFREGRVRVLTNCEVLTEGFDDPGVDCILMARPTKSRALYTQAVGRGLRLHPGKANCLVLDGTDNCKDHKLVGACKLFGLKKHDAGGKDVLLAAEEEAEEERVRQERLRADTEGPVVWWLESVCPWPGLPTLKGYKPRASWQDEPATDKQLNALAKFGLGLQKEELTKGEAGHLLDQCFAYEAAYPAPATPNQEWRLRYLGLWQEGMTKREAGRVIGEWRAREKQGEGAAP
jgi:superfamily II DNA or RNA helicase